MKQQQQLEMKCSKKKKQDQFTQPKENNRMHIAAKTITGKRMHAVAIEQSDCVNLYNICIRIHSPPPLPRGESEIGAQNK